MSYLNNKDLVTLRTIRKIIKRISFTPNVTIAVSPYDDYHFMLDVVQYPVADATRTNPNPIIVKGKWIERYPDEVTTNTILLIVEYALRGFHDHEFKEWFQFDRVPVYNPHPEVI